MRPLAAVADLLKVDVSWFYDDDAGSGPTLTAATQLDGDTAALVRIYRKLPSKMRRFLLRIARDLVSKLGAHARRCFGR